MYLSKKQEKLKGNCSSMKEEIEMIKKNFIFGAGTSYLAIILSMITSIVTLPLLINNLGNN